MKPKLIFDKQGAKFILEALGRTVDKKGYVMNGKKRQLDANKKEFKVGEFMGVVKHRNRPLFFTSGFQLIRFHLNFNLL